MRIGIIAALPGELKPLVKGWDRLPAAKGSGIQMWQRPGPDEVVAVCAGMGAAAARRAFTAAEFGGAMDMVCSVGWAGALTAVYEAGATYEIDEVVDAQTGERFTAGEHGVRLVTTVSVAGADEKRRLGTTYGAALVDMEAAVIARLAQMREIPMRCFKGVSDGMGVELPDMNPFIDVAGQMKMVPFLAYVLLRPGYWGSLMQFGMSSAKAARSLGKTVESWLDGVLPTSDGDAV